jgi:hypothetical protein
LTFDIYVEYNIVNNIDRRLIMETEGMVIRLLYNNQGWKAPCTNPSIDPLCHKCFDEGNLDIKGPSKEDEVCSGICWERDLCTDYEWGCTPKGRKFNQKRAKEGAEVFFVFQQPDNKYTLWGSSNVTDVNVPPIKKLPPLWGEYKHFMRFVPFEQLPKDQWVKDLTDVDLVEEVWKMGRYRFISPEKKTELMGLIEGTISKDQVVSKPVIPVPETGNKAVSIVFSGNIYKKLAEVGKAEGRQVDEIVKEAVAEWLRGRGWLTVPGSKS